MRLAFVCTANMCRSPLAEHICRRLLESKGIRGVEVSSSGVFAFDGSPPIGGAARAAENIDLDISGHRSKRFDGSELNDRDLILVMEEIHRKQILAESKVARDTVRLLGEFGARPSGPPGPPTGRLPNEIDDPIGGPDVAFEACVARLTDCIEGLVRYLEEERISRH